MDVVTWIGFGCLVAIVVLVVLEERRRDPDDEGVKAFRERKESEWENL